MIRKTKSVSMNVTNADISNITTLLILGNWSRRRGGSRVSPFLSMNISMLVKTVGIR